MPVSLDQHIVTARYCRTCHDYTRIASRLMQSSDTLRLVCTGCLATRDIPVTRLTGRERQAAERARKEG